MKTGLAIGLLAVLLAGGSAVAGEPCRWCGFGGDAGFADAPSDGARPTRHHGMSRRHVHALPPGVQPLRDGGVIVHGWDGSSDRYDRSGVWLGHRFR